MKRYYLAGILVFLAVLIAWHYYAANRAEQQVNKAIIELAEKPEAGFSIEYDPVEISAFNGNIHLSNLSVVSDSAIIKIGTVLFDLSYGDFLTIYIWGTESGLRNLKQTSIHLSGLSFLHRTTRDEYSIQSLRTVYEGDAWELLRHLFAGSAVTNSHTLNLTGSTIVMNHPNTTVGKIKIGEARADLKFPEGIGPLWARGHYETVLDSITWSPPTPFQKKYRFLIEGFGYETDAIPFNRLLAKYRGRVDMNSLDIEEMRLESELFETHVSGSLVMDGDSFNQSRLNDIDIYLNNFSPRFRNFLSNAEKLFGVSIPLRNGGLAFRLSGQIDQPEIRLLER